MNSFLQDLRFSLRQIRRSPGFMVTAVLTLALGVGANTAIFSLLDQALLRSLPVRAPEQLVVLEGTGKVWEGHFSNHGGDEEAYFSYPMYNDLRDQNQVFDGMLATAPADIGFVYNGDPQHGRAELVSGNYFTLLGVRPAVGRLLTQSDDMKPDANPVAVVSFDLWKNRFGADPAIVGATALINDHPFQIVGVSAPGFRSAIWGETPDVFVPMSMLDQVMPGKGTRLANHKDRWINILGRLKPGVSRTHAEASMNPLWHSLRAEELKALGTQSQHFTDEFLTNSRMKLLPGSRGFSYQRDYYRRPLFAVMGMALLVLLMAAANVASLLLVRSAVRAREFSVRKALGAGSLRILRQLLLEGLLIGLPGGLLGMLVAPFAMRALIHQLAGDTAYIAFASSVDTRLLGFNLAIAVTASIFFSLAPALQLRRSDLTSELRQQSATGTGSRLGFRRSVVCLQVGLSVILLVGAGLFVRTMQNLRHVDVGFTTGHLVTFGINPVLAGYAPSSVAALHQRVMDKLSTLPGVRSVAATTDAELAGDDTMANVSVSGYTAPPDDDFQVESSFVTPSYFSTLEIPVIEGRSFTEEDDLAHPSVAIVNESFAKHFCGNTKSCLGRQMAGGGGNKAKLDTEIVGVVRDAKHEGIRDAVAPTRFRPLKQNPTPAILFLYLRMFGDPAQELPTIRRSIQQLDPKLAIVSLRTMDAQIDDDLSDERMISLLAVSFGALATLLAAVGLYGVLAYSTAQRTREIGIRIALGSTRLGVSRLVLADVLRLAGIGIVLAIPCSVLLAWLLRSQLYGVSSADPLTLAGVTLLIAVVAMIAAIVPARRASSVDPTTALRAE
ncbi:ABC transporter permease [Tunturiibacter empetritectus]|uniref:Permease n=1 Tax=Tunturiibacter lichenicola TaxID=2051959 RepID=A0A852VFD8_9BACT|nr:ABC transporter permease [Edaphobacter lichenicola]NYF88156.1 putative permease [Edaphobacter lichenicola]